MTTPLQQAAQAVIARWDSPKWKDEPPTAVVIGALRKALEAEQAQAVEPVAWTLTETLDKRVTTTSGHLWFSDPVNCCWTPLYTHPAPPLAQQVAVPARDPLTEDQIEDVRIELCDSHTISRPAMAAIVRAIEAHHGIKAKLVTKPDSRPTDWSAA